MRRFSVVVWLFLVNSEEFQTKHLVEKKDSHVSNLLLCEGIFSSVKPKIHREKIPTIATKPML